MIIKKQHRGMTGIKDPDYTVGTNVAVKWLKGLDPKVDRIINGVCIGMDEIVGIAACTLGFSVHGIVPSDKSRVSITYRTWCDSWEEMPTNTSYMDRNQRIVDMSIDLTAFTRSYDRILRSGTWSTIRRAEKKGISILIIPVIMGQ